VWQFIPMVIHGLFLISLRFLWRVISCMRAYPWLNVTQQIIVLQKQGFMNENLWRYNPFLWEVNQKLAIPLRFVSARNCHFMSLHYWFEGPDGKWDSMDDTFINSELYVSKRKVPSINDFFSKIMNEPIIAWANISLVILSFEPVVQ
jgi:hypothetical protein